LAPTGSHHRVRAEGARAQCAAEAVQPSPTPGQLFGYMLDTLFMDQISPTSSTWRA